VRPAAVALASLALSLSLAGCSGGGGGDGTFAGTCPQWVKGLSTITFKEAFHNSSMPDQKFDPAHPTGAGLRAFQGHPLDFVEFDFHPRVQGDRTEPQAVGVANATVELRAFRSDNDKGIADQLLIQSGATGETKDTWTWGPGVYANFTLKVPLADPHEAPDTDPVVLRWDFMPDPDPRSPSEAVMLYTAYFWYRTCNSDGSTATG
jgi:hypothetical protein